VSPEAQRSPRQLDVQLFCLGFLTLFIELALIRYLSGNVWNLGYFPNLVLMSAFLGMGVGFIFHVRAGERLSPWLFFASSALLALLLGAVNVLRPAVPGFAGTSANIGGELFFTTRRAVAQDASLFLFGLWFVSIAVLFACLSQRTAKVFKELPPLRAYTLDIAGSVAGILSFMAMSAFQLPPLVWFLIPIPLYLMSAAPRPAPARWLTLASFAVILVVARQQDARLLSNPELREGFSVEWSPYQKVEYQLERRVIAVNGIEHQAMFPIEELTAAHMPYQLPHRLRADAGGAPYRRVLIIGAGSGNDVAAALANGAEHIDAVEIDPVIARLGAEHHPARPYADPRVHRVVDDARAFMTRTQGPYDLVIFALTDSLVKVSSMAQLRLENYLFTVESIRRAYTLLSETGDVYLYNYYREPWLVQKLGAMVREATWKYPRVTMFQESDFVLIAVGRGTRGEAEPLYAGDRRQVPTDDWPFPYLRERSIPTLYAVALGVGSLLVASLLLVLELVGRGRVEGYTSRGLLLTRVAFVLMGLAFLLLETKSIVQFSLLFGTTWINTSLVFLAVLSMVLAANWTATLFRSARLLPLAYALLLASCFAGLAYPLRNLLEVDGVPLRFAIASVMTFSPIFFANLIFSVSFRDVVVPEQLFGWNLLGATIGGFVEYTSMATGYNALGWVVVACYTVVFALLVAAQRSLAAPAARPT
jgi:spermidine synthase